MKTFVSISALLLLSLILDAQSSQTFRAEDNVVVQEEIKNLEFYLASLIEKGDWQTYATYLLDDYMRINQHGEVSTKEEIVKSMQSSPFKGKMTPHDLSVRVYRNTAILTGTLDIASVKDGIPTSSSSLFTKVFIRQDDRWYLASLQGTALKK